MTQPLNLLITTYLEPEHIVALRAVSPRLNVIYEPELIATPRYSADHYNNAERTPAQEARWQALLAEADILYNFDPTHRADLPELAPRVRWIQSSNAGIGQMVRGLGYDRRMPNTVFTTSSGIHAQPLAEFCLLAMLMFAKGVLHLVEDQRQRRWERFASGELNGHTLGILGVGKIGAEVARLARGVGMRVLGTKRTVAGIAPASLHLDALYPPERLDELLAQAEYLVIVTPHTDATEQLIGARELALLPRGAVLINIGRGAVVDEAAMIAALAAGQLGGAALDVFTTEPPPADNPLWAMPNVLISPHSASTSDRENTRLTALFCENLRRYLAGEPLLNVLDLEHLY